MISVLEEGLILESGIPEAGPQGWGLPEAERFQRVDAEAGHDVQPGTRIAVGMDRSYPLSLQGSGASLGKGSLR